MSESTDDHPLLLIATYLITYPRAEHQQQSFWKRQGGYSERIHRMSDKETEDDVGLPKATVFKLIQGQSPLCPNET